MLPQLGLGGCTPIPRKDKALSPRIVPATSTIATAVSSGAKCGSTCRVTVHRVPAPRARLATTNSRSFMAAACVFTSLATPGQAVMLSATMTGVMPSPHTPMMRMARRISGKANMASVRRIIGPASQRGPYTPVRPTMMPTVRAMACTANPTKSDIRAPSARRAKMSRPSSSVPSQYCDDGGKKLVPTGVMGLWRRFGPKTANSTKKTKKTTPPQKSGSRRFIPATPARADRARAASGPR